MKARGFSLLEVIVAFSILSLSLGVLMQIFSGSLNNATVARDQTEATLVAQSLLAVAGVDSELMPGEARGRHGERFYWQLLAEPVEVHLADQPARELWTVRAKVVWGGTHGEKERSVVLTTLRVKVRTS